MEKGTIDYIQDEYVEKVAAVDGYIPIRYRGLRERLHFSWPTLDRGTDIEWQITAGVGTLNCKCKCNNN